MRTTAKVSKSWNVSSRSIDESKEASLHHDADEADQEAGRDEGQDEQSRGPTALDEGLHGRHAHVGAEGVEGPAGG